MALQSRPEFPQVACLPHLDVLAEGAIVLEIDVRQRVSGAQRPRDQRRGHDDRAELRLPERVFVGCDRAVGLQHLDRDRFRLHLDVSAVVAVGARVSRDQRQLAQHEAPRGRDGVAPGDIAVEADVDQGETVDRAPHDVVAPGNRQVYRVEALDAAPREMRVAEQRAGAARELAAEPDGVAAETFRAEVRQISRIDQRRRGVRGACRGEQGGGRCRAGGLRQGHGRRRRGRDLRDETPGAGAHQQLAQHLEHVESRERAHPGLCATIRSEPLTAGIAQVAVVAICITGQQRARVGFEPGPRGLAARIRVQHAVDAIRIQVGVVRARAEPARLRARGHQHVAREHAGVVLGEHETVAVADAAPVGGADVRDAVARARHIGVVAEIVVAGVTGSRAQQCQRGDDGCGECGRVVHDTSSNSCGCPRLGRGAPARDGATRV